MCILVFGLFPFFIIIIIFHCPTNTNSFAPTDNSFQFEMRIVVLNINKNSIQTFHSQAIQRNEYICKKRKERKTNPNQNEKRANYMSFGRLEITIHPNECKACEQSTIYGSHMNRIEIEQIYNIIMIHKQQANRIRVSAREYWIICDFEFSILGAQFSRRTLSQPTRLFYTLRVCFRCFHFFFVFAQYFVQYIFSASFVENTKPNTEEEKKNIDYFHSILLIVYSQRIEKKERNQMQSID